MEQNIFYKILEPHGNSDGRNLKKPSSPTSSKHTHYLIQTNNEFLSATGSAFKVFGGCHVSLQISLSLGEETNLLSWIFISPLLPDQDIAYTYML